MYEDCLPIPAVFGRQEIADHLVRISDAVPAGVQLGHHCCFGDLDDKRQRSPMISAEPST